MAKASKVLLRTGLYQPPQGELLVTPSRLRGYVDKFRQMRDLGIKIPIGWGHQPDANPADASQRARQQYYLSALNAGYLDDLSLDRKGQLDSLMNCPGCEVDPATGQYTAWVRLPDGREVRTGIGEVSVAIRDWTDGQGRLWPDVITHVALTPLPVMADQEGFTAALSTVSTREASPVYYLSLTSMARELSTAEANMADEWEDDDEAVAEGAAKGAEEGEEKVQEPPEKPAVSPPPPATADANAGGVMSAVLLALEAHGICLPPDTSLENLAERIRVAGHKKVTGGDEDEEEEREAKKKEEEDEDEGVSYSGEDRDGQTQEEERPVMMSLATAKTPAEKKLIAREESRHKREQLDLIESLVKKGMPVHEATAYRERLTSYTLSLTEDGEVSPKKLDFELSTWAKALEHSKFEADVLGAAKKQRRPTAEDDTHESSDEIKKRAQAQSRGTAAVSKR